MTKQIRMITYLHYIFLPLNLFYGDLSPEIVEIINPEPGAESRNSYKYVS